jgi:hypothetical protein
MPLASFDKCPSCGLGIQLTKSLNQTFICPICQCEFKHDFRNWFVALPIALLLAFSIWFFLRLPPFIIAFVVVPLAGGLLIRWLPSYTVVKSGKELHAISEDQKTQFARPQKESRWFMVLLFVLVAVILTILIYSIISS